MLRVRNWRDFQHYKKRNPPWIKLHFGLLSSTDWVCLDDASRVLAVACMLIASKHDGCVPEDAGYFRRVAYLNTNPDFTPLIACGFLQREPDSLATNRVTNEVASTNASTNARPEQSRAEQSRADSLTLTAPSEAENGERERVAAVMVTAKERLPTPLVCIGNALLWLEAAGGDVGVAKQGICDCAKTKPRTPEYVRRAIELRAAEKAASVERENVAKAKREAESKALREPKTWEEWHRHGMIVKGLNRDDAAKLATERAGKPPWAGGAANGHVGGRDGATGHARAICGQSGRVA